MTTIDAIQWDTFDGWKPKAFEYNCRTTLHELDRAENVCAVISAAAVVGDRLIRMVYLPESTFFVYHKDKQYCIHLCANGETVLPGTTEIYAMLDTSKLEAERDALQAKIDRINALKITSEPATT